MGNSEKNDRLRHHRAADPEYREDYNAKARHRHRNIPPETRAQRSARNVRWQKENPEAVRRIQRDAVLRKSYGITHVDYDAMLSSQGGACAICGGVPRRPFHVDHDHATGGVRGLLCENCNHMIGKAADDPARLRAAANYLDHHKANPRPRRTIDAGARAEIRQLHVEGFTVPELAKHYGVTEAMVEHVVCGKVGRPPVNAEPYVPRGRPTGAANKKSKLTEETVREIRRRAGEGASQHVLAAEFGVRQGTISQVVRLVTWKQVA